MLDTGDSWIAALGEDLRALQELLEGHWNDCIVAVLISDLSCWVRLELRFRIGISSWGRLSRQAASGKKPSHGRHASRQSKGPSTRNGLRLAKSISCSG